jgi:DNA-binding response OmpR family regulator
MAEVLIVDDDDLVRGMLGYLFSDAGFGVREAENGQEALDVLSTDAPECMVLDLMMPKVDGYAVLRERRRRGLAERTRVVILTAKSDTRDAVWCWELGADQFLTKPFDPETLLSVVRGLLDLTPEAAAAKREEGIAEARRLDELEAAFKVRRRR